MVKAAYLQSNKQGVDVVVDNVGAATWEASLRTLKRGGRLLTVGSTTGYRTGPTPINIIFGRQVSIIGSTMGSQMEFEDVMRLIFAANWPCLSTAHRRRGAPGAGTNV
ncbi:MAG: zinc-binding dehydrogenase [Caldilineales bacterium]